MINKNIHGHPHLRINLVLIAVLLLLFLFSRTAFADELTSSDKKEALEYSAELLEGVSLSNDQNDLFGIPPLDFNSLALSDAIPAYEISAGDILRVEENYWLIYQNDTAIATLVSYTNETGTLYRLTSLYTLELDQILKTNSECFVLSYEEESCVYSKDDILIPLNTKQNSTNYSQLVKKISDIRLPLNALKGCEGRNRDLISFDNNDYDYVEPKLSLEREANEKSQEEIQILTTEPKRKLKEEIHFIESGTKSSIVFSKLPVPKKQQVGNTCWSTSVSSIGEFLTGIQLTGIQICQNLGISQSSGGTDQDALNAFGLFVYPGSSTSIQGTIITSAPPDWQIKNWINNGIPIYAHLRYSSTTADHAVVVCGWGQKSSNPMYIFIMNPGTGKEEILTKSSGGVFQFFYNQKTYKWNYSSIMLTGWQKPYGAGDWCYMNPNGSRVTGWKKVSDKWYYFDSFGIMQTGWQKINGKWYYMNSSGVMQTGWKKIGGQWYYLGTDGAAVTGWEKINGYWYSFDSSCAMRKGWFKEGNNWYYLRTANNVPVGGPEGSMLASGAWKIGTKAYIFDASGVCQNP